MIKIKVKNLQLEGNQERVNKNVINENYTHQNISSGKINIEEIDIDIDLSDIERTFEKITGLFDAFSKFPNNSNKNKENG